MGTSDIYGDSKIEVEPATNGVMHMKKTKTIIQLSMRDYLPAHGPISSMTFSVAMNGVCCHPASCSSQNDRNSCRKSQCQNSLRLPV